MNYLACKFVDYLIVNQIMPLEKRKEHIYNFEVLFGKILNYGTLLLLSYIDHNILPNLLFMVTFFSLRGRTGGFHAKTPFICYLGTLFTYYAVSKVFTPFLMVNSYSMYGMAGISVIIIFLFAPINHPNLALDREEIRQCKKYARVLAVLVFIYICTSIWLSFDPVYSSYVTVGVGLDAGFMLLAKLFKQEVKEDEESDGKDVKGNG